MAGPGIRSYRFAVELSKEHEVTLSVPFDTDLAIEGVHLVHTRPDDERRLTRLASGFDTVIAQNLPVRTMEHLVGTATRTVYDLYTPTLAEQLAHDAQYERSRKRELWFRCAGLTQEVVLRTGDAFVCASERQRDFWLGALASLGRLDSAAYQAERSLRHLIDVVPFGIEPDRPIAGAPVLKGVMPGIASSDKLLIWAGGIWDWLDPLTVIRAVHILSQERSDVRLYFLGLKHPNPTLDEMSMVRQAVALAERLGLLGTAVFFNFGWVPYEARGRYLLEADLGVSAHLDDLETRLAFRTRVLDYFWAGLPVVTTRGDSLSEFIQDRGLGLVVDYEDVGGWATAIGRLLDDAEVRAQMIRNTGTVRQELAWPRVVATLARLAVPPAQPGPRPLQLRVAIFRYLRTRAQLSVALRGPVGTAKRLVRLIGAGILRRLR